MIRILKSKGLIQVIRAVLGLTFLYSAWTKMADPPGFAQMIWNYRILPGILVNPMALLLPWIELLAGVALITGWLRKGAALLVGVLLLVFIAALSVDLARGIAVDCGCFAIDTEAKSAAELFRTMKLDLLRDVVLLVCVAIVFTGEAAAVAEHR